MSKSHKENYFAIPVIKISVPIAIKTKPPKILALPARHSPSFFPRRTPVMQIIKVTAEMIAEASKAIRGPYSARVKPTERASSEVARP